MIPMNLENLSLSFLLNSSAYTLVDKVSKLIFIVMKVNGFAKLSQPQLNLKKSNQP